MVEASEAIGDYFERFALFTHTYYIACLNSVGGNVNDFAVDSDMLVEHELTGCGTGFCDAKAVYHIIEAAFEELCDFLGEQKLQRVGAFPYSPEEGTPAARMLNRVDTEEAQRRAELVMEIQTQVMDEFNDSRMGDTVEVLCDGYDVQAMSYVGRSYAESPGIDGCIFFTAERDVEPGDFVMVRITGAMDGDLTGEAVEELSEEE